MKKTLTSSLLMLMFAGGAAHSQDDGTLSKIAELGEITVGHRDGAVPFSYYDDKQKPVGYAMDLCAKVVDAVKVKLNRPDLKVTYMPVTGTTRMPLLANGTIDMGWHHHQQCGPAEAGDILHHQLCRGDTHPVEEVCTHRFHG